MYVCVCVASGGGGVGANRVGREGGRGVVVVLVGWGIEEGVNGWIEKAGNEWIEEGVMGGYKRGYNKVA